MASSSQYMAGRSGGGGGGGPPLNVKTEDLQNDYLSHLSLASGPSSSSSQYPSSFFPFQQQQGSYNGDSLAGPSSGGAPLQQQDTMSDLPTHGGPSSTVVAPKGKEKGVKKEGSKEHHQRHMWSVDETEALIAGCQKHGVGNWKAILNDADLRPRFSADRNPGDLKDRFRTKFPQAYAELYPNAKTHIPSRRLSEGSKSHFEKGQSKERRCFSPAEDAVLKQGFASHGSSWTIIAKDPVFGGRRKPTDLRDRFRNAWPQEYALAGYSARRKGGATGSTTSKGSGKGKERTLSHGSSRQSHSHHNHAVPLPSATGQSTPNAELEGIFVRGPDGKPTVARSMSSTSASSSSNHTLGNSESEAESDIDGVIGGGGVDFAWLRDTAGYSMSPSSQEVFNGAHLGTTSPFELPPDFARSLSFGSGMPSGQGGAANNARPLFGQQFSSPGHAFSMDSGAGAGLAGSNAALRNGHGKSQMNGLSQWHPGFPGLSVEQGSNGAHTPSSNAGSHLGGFSPAFPQTGAAPASFSADRQQFFAGQSQSLPPSQAPPAFWDPTDMDMSSIGDAQLQQINQLLQSYVQNAGSAEGDQQTFQGGSGHGQGYASDSDAVSAGGWASDTGLPYPSDGGGSSSDQSAFQAAAGDLNQSDAYWNALSSSMNGFPSTNGQQASMEHPGNVGELFIRGDAPLTAAAPPLVSSDVGLSFLGGANGSHAHHSQQQQQQQQQQRQKPQWAPAMSNGLSQQYSSSGPGTTSSSSSSAFSGPPRSFTPESDRRSAHSSSAASASSELEQLDLDAGSMHGSATGSAMGRGSNWHEEGYEEDEEPDDDEDEEEDEEDNDFGGDGARSPDYGEHNDNDEDFQGGDDEEAESDEEDEDEEEEQDEDDLLPRSNTIRPPKRLSSEEDDYGRRAALLYHQQNGGGYLSSSSDDDEGGGVGFVGGVVEVGRGGGVEAEGGSVSSLLSTPEGSYYAPSLEELDSAGQHLLLSRGGGDA